MTGTRYFRLFLLTALGMLLAAPLVLWGMYRGSLTMRNAPILWIPAENEQRQQYEWFRKNFEVRDAAIVSWPGCTVDDPRLAQLADALRTECKAPEGKNYQAWFDQVFTGQEVLENLLAPPLVLPREEAIARLQNVLIGPDGETTCLVVVFTETGMDERKAALEAIARELKRTVGIDPQGAFLSGSPVDNVAIDQASAEAMSHYLLPSGLLVLVLCRLCLGSWRFTFAVISVALFGEMLVLSLVYFIGAEMNAVLTVMAPLVFVLAVSSGVHLVNYHRDEVLLRGRAGAVTRALKAGWAPCTLSALTTAIGTGSLVVSEIIPVQQFGALSAVGVVATASLLFLILPGIMQRWPKGEQHAITEEEHPQADVVSGRGWHTLAGIVRRGAIPITLVMLGLMIFAAWGLSDLRTSVNVLSLLTPESRIIRDYRWMEEKIAPMVPIEVVVQFPAESPLDLLQRIEILRQVEAAIRQIEILGGTMSAASFVPDTPAERGLRGTIARSVLRSRIDRQREAFAESGYLHESDDWQSWRISTRAPAMVDLHYGPLMQQLREQVDPVLELHQAAGQDGPRAIYTGITPLVHVAQQTLLHDLISSYLTALVLVALVMIAVLRSISAGLLAMLPNLLPTLLLFGPMGWLDLPVDIGSMMTASVALGIAIDGTLHFLTWYQRELRAGYEPWQAVERTFNHCGNAMWQTTAICGLGLLVFALSDFVPTQRFAWMMLMLLVIALAGDLILLPAMVIGPFRRIFEPRENQPAPPVPVEAAK